MSAPSRTALVVQHTAGEGPGRLAEWLAAAGLRVAVVHAYDDQPVPVGLDGVAALIVLGGPQQAFDDPAGRPSAPWLPATRALLRRAADSDLPTLGVCLGAQLLAVACGGRVAPAAAGEYGAGLVAKRDAALADPLFGPVPFTPDVLQWHEDEIVALPAAAVLLASSTRCAHQAFRVGASAWGLQFHIETTPGMVRRWATEDAAALRAHGIDPDLLLARSDAVHPDLEEVWAPFTARFAALAGAPAGAPAPPGPARAPWPGEPA